MTIRQHTNLLLVVAFASGLGILLTSNVLHSRMDRLQETSGTATVDYRRVESFINHSEQWLTTMDLLSAETHGNYLLADRLLEDCRTDLELLKVSRTLSGVSVIQEVEESFEATILAGLAASYLGSVEEDTEGLLVRYEKESLEFVEDLDDLKTFVDQYARTELALLESRRLLTNIVVVAVGILFALVLLGLRVWTVSSLVKPVLDLTEASRKAMTEERAFEAPIAGPSEIRSMTNLISDYVGSLENRVDERTMELQTEQRALIRMNAELEKEVEERGRTEKALEEERASLEKKVESRTQKLRESLDEIQESNLLLEQANRHKSRFLSTMSHELRTPLNAILGFNALLKEPHFGTLNEKQTNYVRQVDESAKHLLQLVTDLLDVVRIDAGATRVQISQFQPAEFVNSVVRMLGMQFQKKDINLTVSIDPDLEVVTADYRLCKQILTNLLTNACKYTPEGGTVEIAAQLIHNGGVKFLVIDSGMGIEREQHEKIFTEFFQTDQVRDGQLGGVGIGLALTRRLVELHAGEIGVKSTLGQGSTFWFTLPFHDSGIAEKLVENGPEESPTPRDFSQRLVLVAEDNQANLNLIVDILSMYGPRVIVARNGREAIDLAISSSPDLVLMDLQMPVMNGFEATRTLRAMPAFSKLPIIALTATVDKDNVHLCLEAGCTSHVSKPIKPDDIKKILDRFLVDKSLEIPVSDR